MGKDYKKSGTAIFLFSVSALGVLLFFALNGPGKVLAAPVSILNNCWAYTYDGPYLYNGILGYKFTPNSNGRITSLCGYAQGLRWVKLYDASYNILASTQVNSSGSWVCVSISSVNVYAGFSYYVTVDGAASGNSIYQKVYLFVIFPFPRACGLSTINTSVYQSPLGNLNASHGEIATKAYGADVMIDYNDAPSNTSLTFTNPTSTNTAIADATTEWNFQALVSDPNGYANLDNVKLRLANADDNSAPYQDLEFTWTQSSNIFSQTGGDADGEAALSAGSGSSCAGNGCTLNFKIKFNSSFDQKTINYNAGLYTADDFSATDEDTYTNFYKVISQFPVNNSLTFTNPTSTNAAIADGTTEWNFQAQISDPDGFADLASTTLRLADSSDNTAPFDDLKFTWTQSTNSFVETGADALGAVSLSVNSTSSCAGTSCALDFKVIFNSNFQTKAVDYSAQLYAIDDTGQSASTTYSAFYKVSGLAPTNDSLTFTNPTSTNTAIADGTTEWNFQALVSDSAGCANLTYVKLRLADVNGPQDLEFTWTEGGSFVKTSDPGGFTSLSAASNANCAGNTWTLNYKIKFNSSFETKETNYSAKLYTTNDGGGFDEDIYTAFYKVKPVIFGGIGYVTDPYDNETMIAFKTNMVISGSQAKLSGGTCWGIGESCDPLCNVSAIFTHNNLYPDCDVKSCGYWERPGGGSPVGPTGALRYSCYNQAGCSSGFVGYWPAYLYWPCSTDGSGNCYEGQTCSTRFVVSIWDGGTCLPHNDNLENVCDSTIQLNWVEEGTKGTVSGIPFTKYTGSDACSGIGSGTCYKLSNPGVRYTGTSNCIPGGNCLGAATYYDQTQCQWLGVYDSPGTIRSINLLQGHNAQTIDSFVYNLSAKPSGSGAVAQFSTTSVNWYNSSGVLGGTDTLTTGVNNTINLSGLGWSGPNFYYRVTFTSGSTPVLDDITVNYTPPLEEYNVFGWAWSESIGWVSFNCENQAVCDTSSYGVSIDGVTGAMTGYAWSESVGWISFKESDLVGCPTPPCKAEVDFTCPAGHCGVSGWAKVLNPGVGASGWISLSGANYEVWVNSTEAPHKFYDWAWSEDFGWLSFNCANQGCGASNYFVYTTIIIPPSLSNLSSDFNNACGQSRIARLNWDTGAIRPYDYEILIDDNSDLFSPEITDSIFLTNSTNWAASCSLCCDVVNPPYNCILFGGNTYYWGVRVRNSPAGDWTEWQQGSFQTKLHCYPTPDFLCNGSNCSDLRISEGEVFTITDNSTAYGTTTVIQSCTTTLPQDAVIMSSTSSDCQLEVAFMAGPDQATSWSVTDSDGFVCSTSKPIDIRIPLPLWKEIKPF